MRVIQINTIYVITVIHEGNLIIVTFISQYTFSRHGALSRILLREKVDTDFAEGFITPNNIYG